ncbi:MAG: transcriptional repressor [Butyrivibrio sp.]|jgi:Fur family ferric uptake transcriptional regulator|nr:transcriptional repressor [Butyrivibrio sp.]MCR4832934.1 transcriptional repressor [Butyrivibrio sp.]
MAKLIKPACNDAAIDRNWPEGVKKTRQRIEIYKILSSSEIPVSAADIFKKLTIDNPKENYAFSTVYRSLLAFENAGVVSKTVFSTDDNALYELKTGKHRHYAVCLKCHTKFALKGCPILDTRRMLGSEMSDFMITGHQLEIYGYCGACKSE